MMHTEFVLTEFVMPLLFTGLLYGGSLAASRMGLYRTDIHRSVWNFVLLFLFLASVATGILLCFKELLPDLGTVLRLHNQSGAGMAAAGLGHALERSGYFVSRLAKGWKNLRAGSGHAAQVAAALVVMGAILAAPPALVRLTAERSARRFLPPVSVPVVNAPAAPTPQEPEASSSKANAISSSAPQKPVVTPTAARTVAKQDSPPLAPGEAARVLAMTQGGKRYVPPQIENRSDVKTRAIQDLLRSVEDPEIGMSLYDLGLVRRVEVDSARNISIGVVFTSPTCPNNSWLLEQLRRRLAGSGLFREAAVQVLRGSFWSPDFVSEEGRQATLERGKW